MEGKRGGTGWEGQGGCACHLYVMFAKPRNPSVAKKGVAKMTSSMPETATAARNWDSTGGETVWSFSAPSLSFRVARSAMAGTQGRMP